MNGEFMRSILITNKILRRKPKIYGELMNRKGKDRKV